MRLASVIGAQPGGTQIQQIGQTFFPSTVVNPQVSFPLRNLVITYVPESSRLGESSGRKNWMPKMDFSKFDGTNVRIWVDKCQTFFTMYKIPEGFKVATTTMYMVDVATN